MNLPSETCVGLTPGLTQSPLICGWQANTALSATGTHARILSHKVVSTSLQPHELGPARLLHEILQARILEWVTISSSRGYSQPRDGPRVFYVS